MASSKHHIVARDFWDDGELISTERAAMGTQPQPIALTDSAACLERLVRTIEGEIIPRLVLAHSPAPEKTPVQVAEDRVPSAEEVAKFTDLVLTSDVASASAHVNALQAQGTSLETIFLHLLAPTARRLGELWSADICDFAMVTVGLGRLQLLLRELSRSFHRETEPWANGRRAMLSALPGEQHTLGILMVAEFLRRAGWDVLGWPAAGEVELVETVHNEWFALLGLSLGSEAKLEQLAALILSIRKASLNKSIGIMVGGPVFIEHPEYVARVGADTTATDARLATIQAENMLALLPVR